MYVLNSDYVATRYSFARSLRRKIKQKVGIEQIFENMSSTDFLEFPGFRLVISNLSIGLF